MTFYIIVYDSIVPLGVGHSVQRSLNFECQADDVCDAINRLLLNRIITHIHSIESF